MSSVRITEIKETKKGRYALFCDGEFLFSIDDETLSRHRIRVGCELGNESLMQLRAASDYQSAKNKAFDLLALRDHSVHELQMKLERKFDPHTAQLAVEKVGELGLLDDGRFASRYAAELVERRGSSVRAAAAKLREKGIDKQIIEEVLDPYKESEMERIKALIDKKYSGKLVGKQGREAVFASLARRGFSPSVIRAELSNIEEDDITRDDYFDDGEY
ncbi:MAG: regulatory protein RecX [Oscillospiraceae bacterium]